MGSVILREWRQEKGIVWEGLKEKHRNKTRRNTLKRLKQQDGIQEKTE